MAAPAKQAKGAMTWEQNGIAYISVTVDEGFDPPDMAKDDPQRIGSITYIAEVPLVELEGLDEEERLKKLKEAVKAKRDNDPRFAQSPTPTTIAGTFRL